MSTQRGYKPTIGVDLHVFFQNFPKKFRNLCRNLFRIFVPEIFRKCSGIVPEMFRKFSGFFPENSGNCPDMFRKCSGKIPELFRNLSGNFLIFSGNSKNVLGNSKKLCRGRLQLCSRWFEHETIFKKNGHWKANRTNKSTVRFLLGYTLLDE